MICGNVLATWNERPPSSERYSPLPADAVLAIRFVPDGDNGDAAVRRHRASLQLGLGLMRETIPYADGEFFQSKHMTPRL